MYTNCVFTICATNYIGLAKVLGKSIRKYTHDIDYYIIVADEPGEELSKEFDDNIYVAKKVLSNFYSEEKWNEMAFKYDLTEFCTAIKPTSIKFLFEKGYEKCVYFDPDILVFSSIDKIYKSLDEFEAVVTPHISDINLASKGNIKEQQLLCSGVFNLGFIGLRSTNRINSFIDWWSRKLQDKCFASISENLFTDQKWMDLLPCFLGNDLCISHDLGMNMAPWNFHERKVLQEGHELFVCSRTNYSSKIDVLVFVHFSGYDYSALIEGKIIQKNITDIATYDDLNILFDLYKESLNEANFDSYMKYPYSYGYFKNGYAISKELRRLFRGLVEAGVECGNPFETESYLYQKAHRLFPLQNCLNEKKIIAKINDNRKNRVICFINCLLRGGCMLFGFKRYYSFYRMIRFYSVWENHYFLMKPKGFGYKMRGWF